MECKNLLAMAELKIVTVCLLLTTAVTERTSHTYHSIHNTAGIIACGYSTAAEPSTFLETRACPNGESCDSGPSGSPLQVKVDGVDMGFYFCDVDVADFVRVGSACRAERNGADVMGSFTKTCPHDSDCNAGPVSYTLMNDFHRYGLVAEEVVDLWFCDELPPLDIENYLFILSHNACDRTVVHPHGEVTTQVQCEDPAESCIVGPVEVTRDGRTTTLKFCGVDDSNSNMLDIWSLAEAEKKPAREIKNDFIQQRHNDMTSHSMTTSSGDGDERELEESKSEFKKENLNSLETLLEKLRNNKVEDLFG